MGARLYRFAMTIRATNHKSDPRLPIILKGLDFFREIFTAQCFATFIEYKNEIGMIQPLQYNRFGRFTVVDFMKGNLPVTHAGNIVLVKFEERAAFQAADCNNFNLWHVLHQTGRAAVPSATICGARHIFSML